MAGPLSNIRVLDMSRILAGPWSGQILADLGAEVIKIERKGPGDDTRAWGPPYLEDMDGNVTGESGYFLSVNRGKKSVELDLSTPEGQLVIRRLAERSDILLENFKVGTLAKFGLDYESLKETCPQLIYCSITGFGSTGPNASDVAYDFMIQAMGGLMSVTGGPDDEPGGGPQKVGVPIIDIMTGMYASVGVLAALSKRNETGQGEYIDLAMLDVAVATLANQSMNCLVSRNVPRRQGNRHPNIQPQDVFPVADGYIVIAVGNDSQFEKFARAIGLPELAADPDFTRNEARVRNLDRLMPVIGERLAVESMDHWLEAFRQAGVPCSPINTIDRVFREPQVVHREMLRELPHPLSGTLPQVVSPLRFANAPLDYTASAPLLGADTDAVLAELGLNENRQGQ